MTNPSPSRREFLQTSAAGRRGLVARRIGRRPAGPAAGQRRRHPLRPLGKTGEMVSLLCLGGHSSTNPQKLVGGREPQADPAGRR